MGRSQPPRIAMDTPFVNIHTHRRTGEGIELVSAMAGVEILPARPRSVGIHPWQVTVDSGGSIAVGEMTLSGALLEIETAAADAIGETGLDYARSIPHSAQEKVFRDQLAIASERRLPVVVHCVKAFEPAMDILAEYELRAVIFHGFIGSRQQALRAVRAGYFLSFGARSFASARTVEAMRTVPVSKIFLETDESHLTIGEIYARAAALLDIETVELKKEIYKSYVTVFGK